MLAGRISPEFFINQYGPIEVQSNREQFMLYKIREGMSGRKVGLFVCGTAHLHSMSEKLRSEGFVVQGFY